MPDPGLGATPATADEFRGSLLLFVNRTLPDLHARIKGPLNVQADTPLFEGGLIDSLAILDLIAFVERATGTPIDTPMVTMKHFRTIDAICAAFWNRGHGGPDDVRHP